MGIIIGIAMLLIFIGSKNYFVLYATDNSKISGNLFLENVSLIDGTGNTPVRNVSIKRYPYI